MTAGRPARRGELLHSESGHFALCIARAGEAMERAMDLIEQAAGAITIIEPRGRIDSVNAREFGACLARLLDGEPPPARDRSQEHQLHRQRRLPAAADR